MCGLFVCVLEGLTLHFFYACVKQHHAKLLVSQTFNILTFHVKYGGKHGEHAQLSTFGSLEKQNHCIIHLYAKMQKKNLNKYAFNFSNAQIDMSYDI